MSWRCSSRLSSDCLNAGNPDRENPGSPPHYSNGEPECMACNAERAYPDKSLRRRIIEALPDWIISEPEFEPYELEHCVYCGEGFLSDVRARMHEMEEHPRRINPPTIRLDELETLLDEIEEDLGAYPDGTVVLERIREEVNRKR